MSKLACFGDSITAGTWTPGHAWPSLICPSGMTVVNEGIGGAALAFNNNDMPPLASWIPVVARRQSASHAVICAGINDLIRTDDVSVMTAAVCSLTDRLESSGVCVWWATITPYRADQMWVEALDARRNRFNGWLRQILPERLIDWEHVLRPGGAYMPTSLSFDALHPNAAGQQLLADFFATIWN